MSSERPLRVTCALLFIGSAAATIFLCNSMSGGALFRTSPSMAWMRMGDQTWAGAAATFLAMWSLMMVAMMVPALAPMLTTFRRSVRMRDEERLAAPTVAAGAAYFLVWSAVGLVAWPIGVALTQAAQRSAAVARALPIAAAVAVLAAGAIQLSPWKIRQLRRCREEPDCCRRLRGEIGVAWRHGLHLGLHCVRCCLPFTLVLVATDVMNLGVMAAVTAAIALERFAPGAERVARALGGVTLALGVVLLVRALA
jgi:predicted metal-binding membrane protein